MRINSWLALGSLAASLAFAAPAFAGPGTSVVQFDVLFGTPQSVGLLGAMLVALGLCRHLGKTRLRFARA